MRAFAIYFCVSYVGILLLVVGIPHMLRLSSFRDEIRLHGVLPGRWALPAAVAVTIAELSAAIALAQALLSDALTTRFVAAVLGLTLAMGVAYLLYLRRLWNAPLRPSTCACSPWRSPMSPASFYPAASIAVTSLIGLVSSQWIRVVPIADGEYQNLGSVVFALPVGWAIIMAVIILLFPASVPTPLRSAPQWPS